MATRRKTKSRKAVKTRKTAVKRKSPARKKSPAKKSKTLSFNAKAKLKAYKDLEKQVTTAWEKLRKDVKRKDRKAILQGRNHLLLLLGECNYMSRECMRCMQSTKSR